ncbi:MAG: translation elongation factor-like protein [Candidatus Micrarchaeia archaeon]
MMEKKPVGKVTHYFTHIGVAVVELSDTLDIGDTVSFEGASTNFQQKVDSMQIERKPIQSASRGQSIGLKTTERVREGDIVYKILV